MLKYARAQLNQGPKKCNMIDKSFNLNYNNDKL